MEGSTRREWHPGRGTARHGFVHEHRWPGRVRREFGRLCRGVGGGQGGSIAVSGSELLLGIAATLVLSFVLMIVHEGVHALVIRCFGGTPRFGATR